MKHCFDTGDLRALALMARGYVSTKDDDYQKDFARYVSVGHRIHRMGEAATLGVMVALWERQIQKDETQP